MKTKIAQIIMAMMLVTIFNYKAIQPAVVSAAANTISTTTREQVSAQPSGLTDAGELEAFLDGLLAAEMVENHVTGTAIAVVKDGKVLLTKGYGYADLEERVPVDADRTLFRLGSVSKLFTWTAVMQMVEQGTVTLDTDVNEYLDFTIPDTYSEPVKLRHLLCHTAGFEDQGMNTWGLQAEQMSPLGEYLANNVPERVFPPGEVSAYSNYGAALAGYIVERVSGLPFEEYTEQYIFAPLGMTYTTFRQPLPDSLAADMASAYYFTGGQYVKGSFEFLFGFPGGAASSTVSDMARFMIAHLQDGELEGQRILGEAAARQMHSQLHSPDPRLDGLAHGFYQNTVNGQRILSHGGDTNLFHNGLYLIPEQGVGLFISNNGTNAERVDNTVMKAFLDHYYPAEMPLAQKSVAGFSERIKPYLGTYTPARSNFTSYERVKNIFMPINASLGSDGTMVVSVPGHTTQLVEVEPGLLQDINNPYRRTIYHTGADDRQFLTTSTEYFTESFFRVPWYGTPNLHRLLFLGGTSLFLVALIAWPIGYVNKRRKGQSSSELYPLAARLARWAAVLFGVVLLVSMLSFAFIFADIQPGFGVPRMYFGTPPTLNMLLSLSYVMVALALAITAFAIVAWVKRYWSMGGRIFYTFLALFALLITWALIYWDMFL